MSLETRIALRYAYSKTKGRRSSSIWITLGISVGLIVLIVISSVISGLQTSQLEKIRNVESFDIIVESDKTDKNVLKTVDGVSSVYEFLDETVLLENPVSGEIRSARIRGIDYRLFSDKRFSQSVFTRIEEFEFRNTVCIPAGMRTFVSSDEDSVNITFVRKGKVSNIAPFRKEFTSVGYYSCSVKDFSSNTILTDINLLKKILTHKSTSYGIYVEPGKLNRAVREIKALYPEVEITTYKDYNRSLYSALMLERAIVYLFLSFIFLIICTNLKTSTYRLVISKENEIGILRAIGMPKAKTDRIFVLQGLILCVIGVVIGSFAGILIVKNINLLLELVDRVILLFTGFNSILGYARFDCVVSIRDVVIFDVLIILLSVLFTKSGIRKSQRRTFSVSD